MIVRIAMVYFICMSLLRCVYLDTLHMFVWVTCSLLLNYLSSWHIWEINPLSDESFANIFTERIGCLFRCFLCDTDSSLFLYNFLVEFCCVACVRYLNLFKGKWKIFTIFSNIFIVLGTVFTYLIHFEMSFVSVMRQVSCFIILFMHMPVLISFLKTLVYYRHLSGKIFIHNA